MIFKVQRPLAGNDMSQALVYNEDRTIELFIPLSEIIDMFKEKQQPKIYVIGAIHGQKLFVDSFAKDQDW